MPGYEKTYWSATVVESLQHEAGVCEQIENEDSLRIALWAKTSRPPPAIIPFCVIPGWRQGAKMESYHLLPLWRSIRTLKQK